jgi:C-3',4' desaturase CrtD
MAYEVVVVGGGIGGLTAAALVAARGRRVLLLEREPAAGGLLAPFEHAGYRFEAGAGLYAGWGPGDLHERVFEELPVAAPETRELTPPYVVRLSGGADVRVGGTLEEFEGQLRDAFPECADAAARFYREADETARALRRAALKHPALATASKLRRLQLAAAEPRLSRTVLAVGRDAVAAHLPQTSARFRRFVDAQLHIFAQTGADACAYLYGAVALTEPLRGMRALRGGGAALAASLVAAIEACGGVVRTNAPVLRLAFDSRGRAAGVELLSGETVEATDAVVSNLTVWDTYGKLVGLSRTPPDVRARLKRWRGWGAYQVFVGVEEEAARRLPAGQLLAVAEGSQVEEFDAERDLLMFSVAPEWDARAPAGARAATLSTFTDAEQWFSFHEDESEHEEQDQRFLEDRWARLHASAPELGAGCEVVETATPRTAYERTRRRLGMVGGVGQTLANFAAAGPTHRTTIPNLFLVGDTAFPGNGVAAVTHSALIAADEIAPPGRTRR